MSHRTKRFCAKLAGKNERPPVRTEAEGSAKLKVLMNELIIQAQVTVEEIENVTQAHIHLGGPDENGPVVAFLFGPSDPVSFEEEFTIFRTLSRGDLVGPLEGEPLSALVEQIRRGNAYVNVHTTQNPDGEIRGQLERC